VEVAQKNINSELWQKVGNKTIKVVVWVVLLAWAALAIFPFLWALMSSFKPRDLVVNNPFDLPFSVWTWDNYTSIFSGTINIFIAYLFAFVLARFHFRGKKILEGLVVACMMFPAFSLLFPIVKILSFLGLYGDQLGVVLPQIALNLGFTTLLLSSFIRTLPKDIEEAAFIDGASMPRVIFGMVLPMIKSAVVTAMIFVFLWSYNDLFLQMIIITDERKFPISLLLTRPASKEQGFHWGRMAAAVTLVSFPIIGVYLLLQRYIIKGLTAGALKG